MPQYYLSLKWEVFSGGEVKDKCDKTQRLHEEFKMDLEHYLKTDERILKPFSRTMNEAYPTFFEVREQGRLPGPAQTTWWGMSEGD